MQPEGDACGAQPTGGGGGGGDRGAAGSADSVRAAAAPGSIPAICLSLRLDRGRGRGAPALPERAPQPQASRLQDQAQVPKPQTPEPTLPFPSRRPGALGGRGSLPPPHHRDNRPSQEAARSQQHPHSHPSHDLKRKKWCRGPQPHFLSLGSGVLRLPSTSDPPQPPPQARSLQSVLTRTPLAL